MMLTGYKRLFAGLALIAIAPLTRAATVEYIHTDALGSVVAVTNAARQILERREYEPFGAQLLPAMSNGPGYTGHVQDAATGMTYMQQRYYDPFLGRFLSVDPVFVDAGTGNNFNRYRYGANNPYGFTDPDGRQEQGRCNGGSIACHFGVVSYGQTQESKRTTVEPGSNNFGPMRSGYIFASDRPPETVKKENKVPERTGKFSFSSILDKRVVTANFVAAAGIGARGTKGIHNSADSLGFVAVGQGLDANININLLNISYIYDNPVSTSGAWSGAGGFSLDLHYIWGISIDYRMRDLGNTLSIGTGPGLGESFTGVAVDREVEN